MALLERIPRRSLTDAVFDQVVDRIVGGRLQPGDALPSERVLCAELGVSRTAVREAMARLVQQRLVVVRQGGETRVLDWREHTGLDLLPRLLRRPDGSVQVEVLRAGIEMRAALAPEVARLAALRAGPEVAAALGAIVDEMAASDDLPRLQALSLALWSAIVTASDNLAYRLAFNSLRDAFGSMREAVTAAMAAELRDRAGYAAMVDAIARGDGDGAAAAARTHITRGLTALYGLTGARGGRTGRLS